MSIDLRPIRTATTTLAILPLLAAPAAAQRILGNSNPNAYVSPIWLQVVPFAASDHTTGQELWGLDVNTLGVAQIADLRPGPEGSSPSGFAYRPNAIDLFFAADNGVNGRELWRTDGTVSGTMMVADIHPAGSSRPTDLVGVGSNVFFVADDGATGRELWRSDGNTTTLVRDIRPNGDSDPRDLVDFNGVLFFSADDGVGGRELWRSDGTPVGTFLVRDLFLGGSSNPRDLTVAGGRLFFAANNAGIGRELHTSDGTAGGTGPVADIRPGGASSTPAMLTGAALPIYFSADDGVHGRELWRSDGTPAGTTLVGDIRPGAASSRIDSMIMAPAAAGVWFVADDGVTGRELWSATGAGAAPLPQLVAGPGSADPTHLTPAGLGIAVFRATTPANGTELWASDGTVGGTGIVADIRPGTRGSRVLGLAPTVALFAGNSFGAMFAADDGSTGLELWRTNGTPAGTTLAANIAPDLPGGRRQPTLEGHAAPTGSSLTFTMLGTPFAFGAIALDLGFGPGLMLPGTIGTYLLGPTPVVQQLLLGSNGEGSLTIGIPTTITAIDLVAQAAELSTSPAPSVFLLSDAATAGVTTTTVGSIPGGGSEATGSYDDENHLYEVTLQFTGTPESGYFEFCNAKTGKCIRPDTGSLYSADLGVVIELTGILPLDWEGQVELYFVDSSGERHLVWKSYC